MLPVELKKAIQLLSDELNWKIFETLAENGRMTWKELLTVSEAAHAKTLNFQLQRLISAGLLDRYEIGRTLEGSTGVLSFELSPLGKNIFLGLSRALDSNTVS